MTRERMYGSDLPFMQWMREQRDLPSYSVDFGFVSTDVDLLVHVYMKSIDGYGTREIQPMMHIETKTRSGELTKSQHDTLFKQNLFRGKKFVRGRREMVWHMGVFVLSMSGTTPDDSSRIRWGYFNDTTGEIVWTQIDQVQLKKLLRFEIHPKTFTSNPFRRHHKTRLFICDEKTELGFVTPVLVNQSS